MFDYIQRRIIGFDYVVDELNLSALGKRALKGIMSCPPKINEVKTELDNVDRIVNAAAESSKEFRSLTRTVAEAKDIYTILNKDGGYDAVELFEIKNLAHVCMDAAEMALQISGLYGIQGWEIADVSEVIKILDPFGSGTRGFFISDGFSRTLAEIRRKKREVFSALHMSAEEYALRDRLACEEQEEEMKIAAGLSVQIKPFCELLKGNMRVLGMIDFVIQKARLASAWSAVKPQFSNEVYLEGVINPFYVMAAENENREFTPVTIVLTQGTTVLSGANMGGKSMLLKTVALNVYLASLGFFVFADHAEVMLFDDIFLVMSDLEDAERGLSSFGGEVMKLNEIIRAAQESYCLILLDEVARGTNPSEGRVIAQGVAKYFNERECVCFFATHYDGVSLYAKGHYRVVGLSNAEITAGSALNSLMDYSVIKTSPSDPAPKEALKVAKLLNLDAELMDEITSLQE